MRNSLSSFAILNQNEEMENELGFAQISDVENKLLLETMFSELSGEDREIIIMHDVGGLTFREIAGGDMFDKILEAVEEPVENENVVVDLSDAKKAKAGKPSYVFRMMRKVAIFGEVPRGAIWESGRLRTIDTDIKRHFLRNT